MQHNFRRFSLFFRRPTQNLRSFFSSEEKWYEKLPKHKMILKTQAHRMLHPIYKLQDIEVVELTHYEPQGFSDRFALFLIKIFRKMFDWASRYDPANMNEGKYMFRFILLETVAGLPGMVSAMCRHMRSLRTMERDHGWIHHLLEEAENERMHLFVFLKMKQPGILFRLLVLAAQGVVFNNFLLLYIISPKTAHRMVGYLEEEAVKTYTHCLEDFDAGKLKAWKNLPAPEIAIEYWSLPKNAMFRDVLLSIRADEVVHREVNHHFASIPIDADIEDTEVEVEAEKKEEGGKKA